MVVGGGYQRAVQLLGRAFIDPAAPPQCPAAQMHRVTLAGFRATLAASQHHAVSDAVARLNSLHDYMRTSGVLTRTACALRGTDSWGTDLDGLCAKGY